MSSIFLSHAHADKPFARKLAAGLRASGHTVWIDEAEIQLGDSLVEKIREGIDQVEYVAAILSSHSISSPWVTRELDLASNREIDEGRVVVLPLLVENVQLPLFLKGKLYADFIAPENYENSLQLLLSKLGTTEGSNTAPESEEIARLKAELELVKEAASQHEATIQAHQKVALRGKSSKLREAIEGANAKFPLHAPINNSYAFEVSGTVVTLDYLLWAIAKSMHQGAHPLEMLLTLDNKWGEVKSMVSAYNDMLDAVEG